MEGQFMIGFLGFPEVSEVQTLLSKPIETTFLESEKKNCYFHMTKVKFQLYCLQFNQFTQKMI